jgi:hypothetical protein
VKYTAIKFVSLMAISSWMEIVLVIVLLQQTIMQHNVMQIGNVAEVQLKSHSRYTHHQYEVWEHTTLTNFIHTLVQRRNL